MNNCKGKKLSFFLFFKTIRAMPTAAFAANAAFQVIGFRKNEQAFVVDVKIFAFFDL